LVRNSRRKTSKHKIANIIAINNKTKRPSVQDRKDIFKKQHDIFFLIHPSLGFTWQMFLILIENSHTLLPLEEALVVGISALCLANLIALWGKFFC